MKIVFIAGSPHSGSTALDMALSGHSRICGLGEVYSMLESKLARHRQPDWERCSCGETLRECPLWGDLTGQLGGWNIYIRALRKTGCDIVCDSSKAVSALSVLASAVGGCPGHQLYVIHLLRDPRGWAMSCKRRLGDGPLRTWRRFGEWHRHNVEFDRFFAARGIVPLTVSYEDFALRTESTMRRVCNFVGIEYEAAMCDLGQSRGHVGTGNGMRQGKGLKSRQILYDNDWMLDSVVQAAYLARARVRRYALQKVHGRTAVQRAGMRTFMPVEAGD